MSEDPRCDDALAGVDKPATALDESAATTSGAGDSSVAKESLPPVGLKQHSNENLLKILTFDKFSTVNAMKRQIAKELPPPLTNEPPGPLLTGALRIDKSPRNPHMFIAFDSVEHREAAAQLLTSRMVFRGKPWQVAEVTERELQLTHKGPQDGSNKKRAREGDKLSTCNGGGDGNNDAAPNVSLWVSFPMEEQLAKKTKHCLSVMKRLLPQNQHGWNTYEKRFIGVKPSPVQNGYRNHVNLSFGSDVEGKPTVGFLRGAIVDKEWCIESAIDPTKDIITMHPIAKAVASQIMCVANETMTTEPSGSDPSAQPLGVFDKATGTGFWRKLQIRHSTVGEVMVDLEIDPTGVSPQQFARVLEKIKAALVDDATFSHGLLEAFGKPSAKMCCVQYHTHTGTTSLPSDAPRMLIYGSPTLTEHLCGLTFDLSATSFFQVNTGGMEVMLAEVLALAELRPTTTLLDLCCGTGTIGLSLAAHVKRVIGIELVSAAVDNAKENALKNSVKNATFVCGRVERVLPEIISTLSTEERADIVAILDPPRAGVAPVVLQWIRGTPTIRRVIYISCEQRALERDCPLLTKRTTKKYRGVPFQVSAGFGVDMFPHTPHVEMIVQLDRVATTSGAEPLPEANSSESDASEPHEEDN